MGECAPHTKALAPYSVFSKRVSILVSLPASVFDRVLQLCSVSVFWFSFPSPLSETCPIKLCVLYVCVCGFFLSFCPPRGTRSTCSGCHAGWLPSPPGAICFSLSRRQGRLERLLVRGRAKRTRKPQSKTAVAG